VAGGVVAASGVGAPLGAALEAGAGLAGTVQRGAQAVGRVAGVAERGFGVAEKLGRRGQILFK